MYMKMSRGKIPFSIMAIVVSGVMLAGLMFAEDLRALTGSSFLKLKANLYSSEVETRAAIEEERGGGEDGGGGGGGGGGQKADDEVLKGMGEKCSVSEGKWVMNRSREVPYSDTSCPYLDIQVTCSSNGRPDDNYLYWDWVLDGPCTLPRFDGAAALNKLRGKRLMFVGDSLQRSQWQSFVCLVQAHIPSHLKSISRSQTHSVFSAKEYNTTIEFYWAPFLVESNSDVEIIPDASKRIVKVDSIAGHGRHWIGADILVFNSYVWWMDGQTIKSLWGSFRKGEEGYEELDIVLAYRLSVKTWANWIDSTINPNSTRVFFTTVSPTHMRSSDWRRRKGGIMCYNETMPVRRRGYWGSGSDKRIMGAVEGVVERMRVPVTFLNITQLSEYRIDGHTSVYTQSGGKVLSDEQKANPRQYADCIHWCLPGVPDTWNRLLYAYL